MRIQSHFLPHAEYLIRKDFDIEREEQLVAAIWLNLKDGFIFTNKRFYWNAKTVIAKGPREAEKEVPVPSNILQKNSGNLGVELLYKNKAKKSQPQFLALDSHIGIIKILIAGIDTDDARFLRRIFIEYVAREHFPYEYVKQTPLDTVSLFCTDVLHIRRAKKEGYTKNKESASPEQTNVQYIHAEGRTVQDIKTYFSARTRRKYTLRVLFKTILQTVVDCIADLIFVAAVAIAVKPVLLYKSIYKQHTPFTDVIYSIGNAFFALDKSTKNLLLEQEIRGNIADFVLYRRSYIFALLIMAFLALKLLVILCTCKGKKRILPLVIAVLPVLASLFIPVAFFPFLIICVLAYIFMQWALHLGGYTLRFKIVAFMLLIPIEYYLLHLFGYPSFVDVIAAVMQLLSFKASWW